MPGVSWLSAALQSVAGLADAVEPFALMQVYQSRKYHKEALQQDRDMHKEGITQAQHLHDVEIDVSKELTREEMLQAQQIHRESLHQTKKIFQHEYALAKEIMQYDHELQNSLHDVSMWAQRLLHSDNKKYTLKLFRKELEHAQAVSRRESIRDHLVQESQRAQTIMIVNTLLVACVFGLLIEGNLPEDTPSTVVTWYSVTMGLAMNMLILSVWFSMNLQSRIAKYRIHGKVYYGRSARSYATFREYYARYCKPIYRLTHCCLWLGMVALIISGTLLLSAKFELHHNNGTASTFYIISQGVLIFLLACVSQVYGTIPQKVDKDEDDFMSFEKFIKSVEHELTLHDHECKKCRLPTAVFQFCPVTGRPHPTTAVCPECNMDRGSFYYCPTTGMVHGSAQDHVGSAEEPHRQHHPASQFYAQQHRGSTAPAGPPPPSSREYSPQPPTLPTAARAGNAAPGVPHCFAPPAAQADGLGSSAAASPQPPEGAASARPTLSQMPSSSAPSSAAAPLYVPPLRRTGSGGIGLGAAAGGRGARANPLAAEFGGTVETPRGTQSNVANLPPHLDANTRAAAGYRRDAIPTTQRPAPLDASAVLGTGLMGAADGAATPDLVDPELPAAVPTGHVFHPPSPGLGLSSAVHHLTPVLGHVRPSARERFLSAHAAVPPSPSPPRSPVAPPTPPREGLRSRQSSMRRAFDQTLGKLTPPQSPSSQLLSPMSRPLSRSSVASEDDMSL